MPQSLFGLADQLPHLRIRADARLASQVEAGFRVFGSGALASGSHPVPFRTRQLSHLAAMVLAFTGWESS